MATVIRAPESIPETDKKFLFLAGSIDNGEAEDWQATVENELSDQDIIILNPRRSEWDSSWEQSINNPKFKEQVEWELDGLDRADRVLMYFAMESKAPITLLELGLMAGKNKLIIVCPDGYWRKGNVEVISSKYDIPIFSELSEAIRLI